MGRDNGKDDELTQAATNGRTEQQSGFGDSSNSQ